MSELAVAIASFVGSHALLSHPLRRPLVSVLGERGFLGLYSVVALATLIWTVSAYRAAPQMQLWIAPGWAWHVSTLIMAVASILFVGSLVERNPALVHPVGPPVTIAPPRGVLRITRHPMMWAIALWAFVHAWLAGTAATLVLAAGLALLALGGARMQDLKKRRQLGTMWREHEARTSFVPFAAQMGRRQPAATIWPGWPALIGGLMLFLVVTWVHPRLFAAPVVGLWRMFG